MRGERCKINLTPAAEFHNMWHYMASDNPLTPLSVGVLQQVLSDNGWSQDELAERSGIHRSTISMQLSSRQRPIRDEHISAYLKALDRPSDRRSLLGAWLRDI